MMALKRVNFLAPELAADDDDPPGFHVPYQRFGPAVGGDQLGASLYELAEGEAICPYHYEYPDEEWLFVIEGTPSVRHPEGEDVLAAGDVVCFVAGPEGAHQVLNRASETTRVIMLSTKARPAVCVYPDSDKIATFTGVEADNLMLRRAGNLDYFDGETGPGVQS
jgi:uncharacterized cupin superfamily protein